jgi:uncharacterized protein (DUF433 family)
VARLLGGLAGGMTTEEVMREYDVSEADVLAALRYAKLAIVAPGRVRLRGA